MCLLVLVLSLSSPPVHLRPVGAMFTPHQPSLPHLPFQTPQQAQTPAQIAALAQLLAGGGPSSPYASPYSISSLDLSHAGAGSETHPFALPSCSFGGGMFTEQPSLHFPTSAHALYQSGFARSAAVLLECSLTFYSAGMEATRKTNPEFKPFKPQPQDVTAIPPPG